MPKFGLHAWIARAALVLNFLGTILLVYSFQATTTDFRFIAVRDVTARGAPNPGGSSYSICADKLGLAAIDATGSTYMGAGNCALWDRGNPAAVVLSDHPWLLKVGLGLSAFGCFVQLALTFARPSNRGVAAVE